MNAMLRLACVLFKLNKTFKSRQIFCYLKYIRLDLTDNMRDKTFVSVFIESHGNAG